MTRSPSAATSHSASPRLGPPARLDADDTAIERFAWLVQDRDQQFLYARLAVHEAIENPALLRLDPAA